MDPQNSVNFSFLDPQLLAQLAALLMIWVQFSKDLISDAWIKPYSLACSLIFIVLINLALQEIVWARLVLYAVIASAGTGLGYKILSTGKPGKAGS